MSKTLSTMLPLGTIAPDFSLTDTAGQTVTRDSAAGQKGLLVVFMCNHCPYVIHVQSELVAMVKEFQEMGVGVVGINANDAKAYPDDSPAKMAERAKSGNFSFPYCYDESQQVAKAYKAACTPDFFLFDRELKLVYRGQMDNSRPGNNALNDGADLRTAAVAMVNGQGISEQQTPSMGCNIKWRPGNEPDYFNT